MDTGCAVWDQVGGRVKYSGNTTKDASRSMPSEPARRVLCAVGSTVGGLYLKLQTRVDEYNQKPRVEMPPEAI